MAHLVYSTMTEMYEQNMLFAKPSLKDIMKLVPSYRALSEHIDFMGGIRNFQVKQRLGLGRVRGVITCNDKGHKDKQDWLVMEAFWYDFL